MSGLTHSAAAEALRTLDTACMIRPAQADEVAGRGMVYLFTADTRTHAGEQFDHETNATERAQLQRQSADFLLYTATRAERILTRTHRLLDRDYLYQPREPVAFADEHLALAWLSAQRDNLLATIRAADAAGLDSSVWQLTHALWPLLRAYHDYPLWEETHALALNAARRCQHVIAELEIRGTWAVGIRSAGRLDEAIEAFDEALRLARSCGDGRGESQALHELGATHLEAQRPEEAEAFLVQARERRVQLGEAARVQEDEQNWDTFRRAVAITDVCLGRTRLLLGRPRPAVEAFSSARETLHAFPDPLDAARALAWLGFAHAVNGDEIAGEAVGRQAVEEFDILDAPRWQAHSRELVGRTLQAAGRLDEARAQYNDALAIYLPISPRDADRVRHQIRELAG